jgi:hypothetical protein
MIHVIVTNRFRVLILHKKLYFVLSEREERLLYDDDDETTIQ